MTIWDGGGEDEYDFGAFTSGLIIDLHPGEWVQTRDHTQTADLGATDKVAGAHYADGIVANALVSTVPSQMGISLIENATGGHGADIFIANQAVNKFDGGDGADFFTWSSFADGQNLLASAPGTPGLAMGASEQELRLLQDGHQLQSEESAATIPHALGEHGTGEGWADDEGG